MLYPVRDCMTYFQIRAPGSYITCPTIVSQHGPRGTSAGSTCIGGAVEFSGIVPLYRLASHIVMLYLTIFSSSN